MSGKAISQFIIKRLVGTVLIILTVAIVPVGAWAGDEVITIYGKLNSCYHFKNPAVFLESTSGVIPEVESERVQPTSDGSFQLHLSSKQFLAGEYYLNFGEQSGGFGSERIILGSSDLNLDTIGDCDL